MKGNKKHIDDLFRDGLKNLELHDTGDVWSRVETTLNEKKTKRRFGFWWWMLPALLLGSTAVLWHVNRNDETTFKTESIIPPSEVEANRETLSQTNSAGTNESGKTTPNVTDLSENTTGTEETITGTSENSTREGEIKRFDSEVSPRKINTPHPGNSFGNGEPGLSNRNPENSRTGYGDNGMDPRQKVTVPANTDSVLSPAENGLRDELPVTPPVTVHNVITGPDSIDSPDSLDDKEHSNTDPLPLTLTGPVFRAGIEGGLLRPYQRPGTGIEDFPEYSAMKSDNESPAVGYTAGLRLGISLPVANRSARIAASTGFLFNEIRFNTPAIRFVQRDSFPFLNPDGDTLYMIPKTPIDSIVRGQGPLKYRSISVPIQFGYAYELTNRLELEGFIGTQLHIITGVNGRTIDSRLELKDGAALSYRKYNLGFNSSLGLNYAAGNHLKLGCRFNYAQFAPNLYTDAASGNVRMGTYGFTLAVYYEISRK